MDLACVRLENDHMRRDGFRVYIWKDQPEDRERILVPEISWKEGHRFDFLPPDVYVAGQDAQRLADDLWNAGVRPTWAKETSELVTAQKSEIEHLRTLVSQLLDMVPRHPAPGSVIMTGKP